MQTKSEKKDDGKGFDIKKKVTDMVKAVSSLTLASDDDMAKAGELQVNVKKFQKYILQEKKKQLDPANETVKAIKAFWAPFEDQVTTALSSLSRAMIVYHDVKEQIRLKEAERVTKQTEKGNMRVDTAIKKLDELGPEKKTLHTGEGSVTFTKIKKVKFADTFSMSQPDLQYLAEHGYLVWDEVKGRRDALAGTLTVGVHIYEETSTNTRS